MILTLIFMHSIVFSAGAYREVYLSSLPGETVVFKAYYWGNAYRFEDFEFMRMDAIVSEKLTYSPRIVDIYGFCALGMINEAMQLGGLEKVAIPNRHGRLGRELPAVAELDVRNKLSPAQKLKYSLDMAEAVLVLHGYSDGIIVHDDIQLSQFLLSEDGTLKLNDFNRAEMMFWNEKDKEYCRYRNNPGHGDVSSLRVESAHASIDLTHRIPLSLQWRAPEEFFDKPLDEKIDIWSLGNNMFALLTGCKYSVYCIRPLFDRLFDSRLFASASHRCVSLISVSFLRISRGQCGAGESKGQANSFY